MTGYLNNQPFSPSQLRQVPLDQPFTDQKPGTSGLRKSSRQFETPHYLESFIEAVIRVLRGVEGGTLLVGVDGRYGNRYAIDVSARMAAAHAVSLLITTTGSILSNPAVSNLIRDAAGLEGLRQPARCRPHHPLHWMLACLSDLIRAIDALVEIRRLTGLERPTFIT